MPSNLYQRTQLWVYFKTAYYPIEDLFWLTAVQTYSWLQKPWIGPIVGILSHRQLQYWNWKGRWLFVLTSSAHSFIQSIISGSSSSHPSYSWAFSAKVQMESFATRGVGTWNYCADMQSTRLNTIHLDSKYWNNPRWDRLGLFQRMSCSSRSYHLIS